MMHHPVEIPQLIDFGQIVKTVPFIVLYIAASVYTSLPWWVQQVLGVALLVKAWSFMCRLERGWDSRKFGR